MSVARRSAGSAPIAFAALFAASAAAQTAPDPERPPIGATEAIAANDALAATAGAGAQSGATEAPAPAASEAVSQAPPGASSALGQSGSWMGLYSASAHGLRLGTWEGGIGFTYSGSTTDSSGSGSAGSKVTARIAIEDLTIRNRGFSIFDPLLVTGNFGVTIGWAQTKQTFANQEQTEHGTLTGYSFDATLLSEKPLYGRVWADRVQGYSSQSFGGTTKDTVSTVGGSLNLRPDNWLSDAEILPYFEGSLQAYRVGTLQESSYGDSTYSDNQVQNVVQLTAHNGSATSDLYVLLEYIDFNYLSSPTGSYRSHGATVAYDGDFGANLDTSWNSVIAYDDRAGDVPLRTVTVNQLVGVHHNSDLRTLYAYNLNQQEGIGGSVLNQNGSASVVYTLWKNLTLSATGGGTQSRFPNGTVESTIASVALNYQRNLPSNGTVFANVQGSFEHARDNLSSGEVNVVDEPHSAPPVLGVGNGFALNNPFVVADSIVVVDTRGGARIPTTIDVDYTVTTDGNLTRIIVLPTSHVIQPSDPLAVSYLYLLPAQANYHSSIGSLTLGVDLGWLGLSYNHTQTNAPQLTSAAVTVRGNTTTDTVTAALRGNWQALQANLDATVARYDSVSLAYKSQMYSAGIDYQPFYALGLDFNGGWSQADYSVPVRRTGTANARIDLNFYAPPSIRYDLLYATLYALHNRITDSEMPSQTLTQFGVRFNYTLGKLTLAASAQYGSYAFRSNSTKNTEFNLSVNRSF